MYAGKEIRMHFIRSIEKMIEVPPLFLRGIISDIEIYIGYIGFMNTSSGRITSLSAAMYRSGSLAENFSKEFRIFPIQPIPTFSFFREIFTSESFCLKCTRFFSKN